MAWENLYLSALGAPPRGETAVAAGLDPFDLAVSAAYTLARMVASYMLSLVVALIIGIAMATNRRVDAFMNPVIDILQSIPILGFFPAAVLIVINALPGALGVELASILLITTSMVWNMIYGVYSSVKSIDPGIFEVLRTYRVGPLTRLFTVYIPAARKALATNSAISWAGGWFFVTAAEVISLGQGEYRLKGLGSYIVEASERGDQASLYVGLAVLVLILVSSYLLVWNNAISIRGEVYEISMPAIRGLYKAFASLLPRIREAILDRAFASDRIITRLGIPVEILYAPYIAIVALGSTAALLFILYGSISVVLEIHGRLSVLSLILARALPDAVYMMGISFSRVLGVLALGAAISIAISYSYIKHRRSTGALIFAGEVLSSIPAVLWWPILAEAVERGLSPVAVSFVVFFQGSFWYIFFNVVFYGIPSFKKSLMELAEVYGIRGGLYVRKIFIPSLYPSIAAGIISASGGAWNSTIVAEYIDLGDVKVDLGGIGSAISRSAYAGDVGSLLIYVFFMATFVAVLNRLLWKKILFEKLGKRYREAYY